MKRWLAVCLLVLCSPGLFAQVSTEGGTLKKIERLGAVYLGYRESAVPFSYAVGDKGVGMTVEVCERVVEAVRQTLQRPDLKIVYVPQPSNLRFTMLIDGIVDMECGASTNTKIRQQRMAFSVSFFESFTKFMVRHEAGMNRLEELNGKTVAVPSATTSGRAISAMAAKRNIIVRQSIVVSRSAGIDLLRHGKVDAFIGDDALLLGAMLTAPDMERFRLMDDALSAEPYGIALRRDDVEFKGLVDATLREMMSKGEMERIYNKWFMQPIPPNGKSLGLPLSPRLRELYARPNDEGI